MSTLTRWEVGAYAVSALLVLSSMIVLPVVRAVDPVLAVAISYAGDSSIAYRSLRVELNRSNAEVLDGTDDPWGRPWRRMWDGDPYSVGPDGLDDTWDDITSDRFYRHPVRPWTKEVLRSPRLLLAATGLLLALWTLVSHETLRVARARLGIEARRAAFIAAAPAIMGLLWVLAVGPRLDERFVESGAGGVVQLPASIAIPLSWALLCYLPALTWRLTRPREETFT